LTSSSFTFASDIALVSLLYLFAHLYQFETGQIMLTYFHFNRKSSYYSLYEPRCTRLTVHTAQDRYAWACQWYLDSLSPINRLFDQSDRDINNYETCLLIP
jgi:hypothetical protein